MQKEKCIAKQHAMHFLCVRLDSSQRSLESEIYGKAVQIDAETLILLTLHSYAQAKKKPIMSGMPISIKIAASIATLEVIDLRNYLL